jgi:hypothetical protein
MKSRLYRPGRHQSFPVIAMCSRERDSSIVYADYLQGRRNGVSPAFLFCTSKARAVPVFCFSDDAFRGFNATPE